MRSRHSREGLAADGSIRAALLHARFRWTGRCQAWLDAGVPVRFDDLTDATPFVAGLSTAARRAAAQNRATLETEQEALLEEMNRLGGAVVRYGFEETVHHLRLWRDLIVWDGAARRAYGRLEATVDGLDQIQQAYWNVLMNRGRNRSAGRRSAWFAAPTRLPPITCAGLWPPTSTELLTGWGDAAANRVPGVLEQAIEIVLKMVASRRPGTA